MDYITVKEASNLWNKDISTIGKLLRQGKVDGAAKIGGHWVIPKNARMPVDARTKEAKSSPKSTFFRFPLYVNTPENSFIPSLSEEETALRRAQLDFLACDFDKAQAALEQLKDSAGNVYVRISVFFFLCLLSAIHKNGKDFSGYYNQLQLTMADDFPYKKDMDFVFPWLFYSLALYQSASDYFSFEKDYLYSPSVTPLILFLSVFDKSNSTSKESWDKVSNTYEIILQQLEHDGFLYEAQGIHSQLLFLHYLAHDEKATAGHARKILEIAYKNHFLYFAADLYPYYQDVFDKILDNYPADFAEKIRVSGLQIDRSFAVFSKQKNNIELYSTLSKSDYRYIRYAIYEYSYKQVADILHLSERTIANRYATIYEKLGVNGKQGLMDLVKESIKLPTDTSLKIK